MRSWLEAARVLHASVRRHEDPARRRPFLLLVEPGLDESIAAALRADGLEIRTVEPLPLPPGLFDCGEAQLRAEGLRFRLWGFAEFDRIMHIDLDALVVAPLDHLFRAPPGVFMSGTINGTRWPFPLQIPGQEVWDRHTKDTPENHWGHFGGLPTGPPLLNTGVLLISPAPHFEEALLDVVRVKFAESDGNWKTTCDPLELPHGKVRRVCQIGYTPAFCAQGITDTIALAFGRRLGDATFAEGPDVDGGAQEGEFLGCLSPGLDSETLLTQPDQSGDHCILEEGYNLQVTLPNLAWHMPYVQKLARAGRSPWILHWPGQPKPWMLGPGQRSAWDRLWWDEHADLCRAAELHGTAPCFLQCS